MFKFSPGGLTVGSDMGASGEQEGWGERCERGRKKSRGMGQSVRHERVPWVVATW